MRKLIERITHRDALQKEIDDLEQKIEQKTLELKMLLEESNRKLNSEEEKIDILEKDRTELFKRINECGRQDDVEIIKAGIEERLNILEKDRTDLFDRTDDINAAIKSDKHAIQEMIWASEYSNQRLVEGISQGLSLKRKKIVHFVRCLDMYNAGDKQCGPDLYFEEFQKNFQCVVHSIKYVRFDLIREQDWVIIGGGGLLECSNTYTDTINKILDICPHVIGWGLGHNRHIKGSLYYQQELHEINYEKFLLFTSRDWKYSEDERYCPCVSCMMPQLEREYSVKRRVGIVSHHAFPIKEFEFENHTNAESADRLVKFIGESQVIITNSFHGAYWSILMGRKVILYKPDSSRFNFFEFLPVVYSGNIEHDIEEAVCYKNALEECRNINQAFFEEVFNMINKDKDCGD